MKALGVLFFLFQFSFLDSCLVVRSTECACPYMLLSPLNINLFSNHPFYRNLTDYEIEAPLISGDNCSLSMYCETEGYSLVVLDVDSTTNFGAYAADAFCDKDTRSWFADTDSGMKKFKRLYGVCVNFDLVKCIPTTPTTALFAFSNDINSAEISDYASRFHNTWRLFEPPRIQIFAYFRFDVQSEEDIKYFSDEDEWFSSINDHIKNPISSLPPQQESDVAKVFEKHMNNKIAPVCGSRIIIVTRNRAISLNTEEIVNKLRQRHISLFTVSPVPVEGSSLTMFNLASRTEGYGSLSNRGPEPAFQTPFFYTNYLWYSVDRVVSGIGSMSLPRFNVAEAYYFQPMYTVSTIIEGTKAVELKMYSTTVPPQLITERTKATIVDNRYRTQYWLEKGDYDLMLHYSFNNTASQSIHVRINCAAGPINYWIPYDN